ncbi:MAG TPA: hypothetical protein VKB27_14840 [Gammaproteobacteria bacterium]|nr:hypothetical protein [Gammaproteobacteria bacterium]
MQTTIKYALLGAALAASVAACSDSKQYETSYCALVDISGTYASEKASVVNTVKAGIVPQMIPGDNLFFVKIDSNSYSEDNLVTKMTLDYRPTTANNQKLAVAQKLDEFGKGKARSNLTDISGALMLCSDYLKATGTGTKVMFVFSDMNEELPAGVVRKFADDEFKGIDIVAMNIIKLNKDSANPEVYRKRLEKWNQRTTASGARSWNTLIDGTKIPEYIVKVKS